MVEVGDKAPDFELDSTMSTIKLDEQLDKNTVLVFYPQDDSSVCSSQLALYNEVLPLIQQYDAQVFGISIDKMKTHEKFAKKLNLRFPLLADDDPKGGVAKQYGVFDEKAKIAKRALVIIDKNGTVRWKYISPYMINPGADGILRALENIQIESDN